MTAGRSLARRYLEELFNAGAGVVDGIDAFERFAVAWFTGFPDRHFEVLHQWTGGDRIATRFFNALELGR